MNGQLTVIASNRTEILLRGLTDRMFLGSSPFTRRFLTVSSPMMKRWLMWKMAEEPGLKIAMGMEVVYLKESLGQLLRLFSQSENSLYFPSRMEMAFAIEKEIAESEDLKRRIEKIMQIDSSHRRGQRKIARFCDDVAKLFLDYGVFGGQLIEAWELGEDDDWQAELWRALFRRNPHWSTPYRQFSAPLSTPDHVGELQVHLFGLNFLSKLHLDFLKRVSSSIPVYLYHLSPSEMYWGDLLSNRELAGLQTHYERKKATTVQIEAANEILMDRNPLLANLGRLGRKMLHQMIDLNLLSDDIYQPPESPSNLLLALQENLFHVANPSIDGKIDFAEFDGSIQVHISPSRRREVENLLALLINIIDQKGIAPNEVIVTAPDISPYVPYIETVFDGFLPTRIDDLNLSSESGPAKAMLKLIQLAQGRWEVGSVVELFELKLFARRHLIHSEDLEEIKQWLKMVGIKWGADNSDRNALLKEGGCRYDRVERHEAGTWEYGFDRMMDGLIYGNESIEYSQSSRLGKLIYLFRSLREDLAPIRNNIQMTLKEWGDYLQTLYEAYFAADLKDEKESGDQEELLALFGTIRRGSAQLREEKYRWTSILVQLDKLLQQKSGTSRENHLHAVRFCSMLPMRAIPAKVIVLLGMEEAEFPRKSEKTPFDLLNTASNGDYRPSTADFDRYLFLETLLSARENLIFSYSQLPGTPEPFPSIYLAELLSYLDEAFTINGNPVSASCRYQHPEEGYHQCYYGKEPMLRGVSEVQYQRALSFYGKKEKGGRTFIPEFAGTPPRDAIRRPFEDTIDIKDLFTASKNPIKSYFNQTLEMWIFDEKGEQFEEEDHFLLDRLDKYQLKQLALKQPVEEVIAKAEKEGMFPPGMFKEIACNELLREVDELKTTLDSFGITPSSLFTAELSTSCQEVEWIDSSYCLVPSIQVDNVQLVGELRDLTKEGLLLSGKESKEELYKNLPKILLLNCLADTLKIEKNLLFAKNGKKVSFPIDNPIEKLSDFLVYYAECLSDISPLLPEWVEKIQKGVSKELQILVENALGDNFKRQYNHYLKWSLQGQKQIKINDALIEKWKGYADTKF